MARRRVLRCVYGALYFSEKLADPNDPTSAVEFYLTVDGQEPKMFDMSSEIPNIVAQQGTVEDWIIENRSRELHAFHIHQLHFLLLDYLGRQVNEDFLRDTVNVPYYDGRSLAYPSIRLRMDFRDPNIVGTFVYHCHLLEHEDKGMMGSIQVNPATAYGRTQCEHHVRFTQRILSGNIDAESTQQSSDSKLTRSRP